MAITAVNREKTSLFLLIFSFSTCIREAGSLVRASNKIEHKNRQSLFKALIERNFGT
jgi:hypothetical protein